MWLAGVGLEEDSVLSPSAGVAASEFPCQRRPDRTSVLVWLRLQLLNCLANEGLNESSPWFGWAPLSQGVTFKLCRCPFAAALWLSMSVSEALRSGLWWSQSSSDVGLVLNQSRIRQKSTRSRSSPPFVGPTSSAALARLR